MVELTVSLKNDEQTFKKKYLIYDKFTMDENDPIVKDCIEDAISQIKSTVDSIVIRCRLDIQ